MQDRISEEFDMAVTFSCRGCGVVFTYRDPGAGLPAAEVPREFRSLCKLGKVKEGRLSPPERPDACPDFRATRGPALEAAASQRA